MFVLVIVTLWEQYFVGGVDDILVKDIKRFYSQAAAGAGLIILRIQNMQNLVNGSLFVI